MGRVKFTNTRKPGKKHKPSKELQSPHDWILEDEEGKMKLQNGDGVAFIPNAGNYWEL